MLLQLVPAATGTKKVMTRQKSTSSQGPLLFAFHRSYYRVWKARDASLPACARTAALALDCSHLPGEVRGEEWKMCPLGILVPANVGALCRH